VNGVDVHRTASMLAVAAYRCQGAVLTLREQYRNMAVQTYFKSRRIHAQAQRRRDIPDRNRAPVRRPRGQAHGPGGGARERVSREVDRSDEADRDLRARDSRGVRRIAGVHALLCAGDARTVARMDVPGGSDGRAHCGRQAHLAVRYRRTEGEVPAANGNRRDPGNDGPHRARRRFRSAGHDNQRQERRHRSGRQRRQDMDHQCPPIRRDRLAVQDRSKRKPSSCGHLDRSRRARRRADRLPRPPEARIQGRREL